MKVRYHIRYSSTGIPENGKTTNCFRAVPIFFFFLVICKFCFNYYNRLRGKTQNSQYIHVIFVGIIDLPTLWYNYACPCWAKHNISYKLERNERKHNADQNVLIDYYLVLPIGLQIGFLSLVKTSKIMRWRNLSFLLKYFLVFKENASIYFAA